MKTIPIYGTTTRLQDLCKHLPYGQRVLVIEYKVNGEKKREQLNENFFINGNKAGIGSKVVIDPKQEVAHGCVFNGPKESGVQIDNRTSYKVVNVGLLIETDPHSVIFRNKDIGDFIKGVKEKLSD